jgi:predicted ABC-type ATPase
LRKGLPKEGEQKWSKIVSGWRRCKRSWQADSVKAKCQLQDGEPSCLHAIAGANGAGKSTLTSGNREIFSTSPLLDPDTFVKPLRSSGSATPFAAGREVLRLARTYLERGESFCVETTLSGKHYLKMMTDARSSGFEIVLVYIGTDRVETNLTRIAKRVLGGGHSVPEADVRRRYSRSFKNLLIAAVRADDVLIFDNSTEQGYQLIGIISSPVAQWFDPLPFWAVQVRQRFP